MKPQQAGRAAAEHLGVLISCTVLLAHGHLPMSPDNQGALFAFGFTLCWARLRAQPFVAIWIAAGLSGIIG